MATNNASVKLTFKIASFILRLLVNIFFYIIIVILIINVSKMAYDFTYQLFGPVAMEQAPGTDIIIEINKGDTSMNVASKLEMKLAIRNKYAFWLKTKLQKSVLMPGTYEVNTSMTYSEILAVITDLSASLTKDEEGTPAGTGTDTSSDADTTTASPSAPPDAASE
jgi:UPF0755 protein